MSSSPLLLQTCQRQIRLRNDLSGSHLLPSMYKDVYYRTNPRAHADPRSMERLGSPFGWGSAVDDLETLADDWHSRTWHSSNTFAYSSEVRPMDFAPIAQ